MSTLEAEVLSIAAERLAEHAYLGRSTDEGNPSTGVLSLCACGFRVRTQRPRYLWAIHALLELKKAK